MKNYRNRLPLGIFILLLLRTCISVTSAGAFLLPDTGQTQCYRVKGQGDAFVCPSSGNSSAQDGSYTMNPPSFEVNSDGTVFDNNTRLMWQSEDDNAGRSWQEANDYCHDLALGGYADWRLPTKKELVSIINYGRYSPAIDLFAFPGTDPYVYWTSSSAQDYEWGTWVVYFSDGRIMNGYKNDVGIFTRCVRGESLPFHSYVDNGGGIVADADTGLMWQQTEAGSMTWAAALKYCEGLSLAGYSDWRLPNVKELETLTTDFKYGPGIDTYFFPGANASNYWSSTTFVYDYHSAWPVNFIDGTSSYSSKSNTLNVRCVRDGRTALDDGEMSVKPETIGFGIVNTGNSSSKNLIVSNIGTADLTINSVIQPSAPFSVLSDTCSGILVPASGNCTVTLAFAPLVEGVSSDELTIASSDADNPLVTVSILGNTAFLLPDTGQTKCYDNSANLIDCPRPGDPLAQDGSYIISPPAYAVNGDGTVTDNNTGLTWQQEDDNQTYNWYEASGTYDKRYNRKTIDYCGNLTQGGYTDWRLPGKLELASIAHYGKHQPAIDATVFTNTRPSCYWSSQVTGTADTVCCVDFNTGQISCGSPGVDFYVRCVRGEQLTIGSMLFDAGDGIISDLSTGLMWQQNAVMSTWESALAYCEDLFLAGYSDWRSPNIRELETIVDNARVRPALDTALFTQYLSDYDHLFFWSSTSDSMFPLNKWYIDFVDGHNGNYIDFSTILGCDMGTIKCGSFVRCVRNVTAGPQPGTLTGTLTDSLTGIPIPDVTVTVTDSVKTLTASTGTDGRYSIMNVTPGNFIAIFERSGYFAHAVNGTLSDGQILVLDIQLILIPPLALAITSPQDGSVVNTSAITVNGSVSNGAEVSVNGDKATVSDGIFSALVFVKEGENIVTATATDQYGQTASCSIIVTLTGLLDGHEIFVNPSELNFGPTNTYSSSSLNITVSNIGTENLVIGTISTLSPPFIVSNDGCSGRTRAESESCTLTIKFSPFSEGTFTDTLTVPSNDADHPSVIIALNGSSTLYQGAYFLPGTGQTECHDSQGNIIDCRYTGQDGQYRMNPLYYTITSDGTVEDHNTALVWQQEDDDIQRTWMDALDYCDNLSLGGFSDWRLPAKVELLSLVDYGRFEPVVDLSIFPYTDVAGYWSSTSAFDEAWHVEFDHGEVSPLNKSFLAYVRCVRGERLSEGPFEDNGDGTVSDLSTGLMWMQYEIADAKDWTTALTICENGTYAGYSDWRLPNIKELSSFYANCYDWSSTTGTANHSQAHVIDSCSGLIGTHDKSLADHYVRCVRRGYTASGTLTGIVTDASNGLPLQAAAVSVTDSSDALRTALTGDDGRYAISSIGSGNFSGNITKDGYNPYSFSGTMTPAQAIIIDATLSKSFMVTTLGDYGNVTVMEVSGDYDAKNPDGSINTSPRQAVAKEFFKSHEDEYDFFVVFTNFDFDMPETNAKGFYLEVKNDTQGIGKALFDNSDSFGSSGSLQGIIEMGNSSKHVLNPLDPKFEESILTLAHEQMHRWGVQVKFRDANQNISTSLIGKDGTHWSFLLDTDGSALYGNDWRNNEDGTFTSTGGGKYYSALDLYLMGMYDKSQVPPMLLIESESIDSARLPEIGATISGTARTVTIDDIIDAEGERIPNVSLSQKTFKKAFILLTRPGTFTGNELSGIENLRNAWAGKLSALTYGNGSIADVTPSLTIAISAPLDGATISGPDVTVTGAIINSSRNETGVTVNGSVATVCGNYFIANNVPLIEGSNTITATATDAAGNTATTSTTVNAETTGHYMRLTSNIESGIAPLEVSIRIDGSFSFTDSNLSITGPIQPEVISSTSDEYQIKMLTEGIYYVTAYVTDSADDIYQDTVVITVMNKTQLDNQLKIRWEEMKTALVNQDVEAAIVHFLGSSQETYRNIFTNLLNLLPEIAANMQTIELISNEGWVAQYRIKRMEDVGDVTYYIYFVPDENGVWKIQQF